MPVFARLGPEAAQAWLAAAPRVWPRWVAGGLLVVGVALGVGFEPPCAETHACSGAYIPVFGIFFGLLVLSALGLWLAPVAGASLGLIVSAIEVLIDPSWQGRVGFAAYGLACLAVILHLRRAEEAQRAVLADVPRQWAPLTGTVAADGTGVWARSVLAGTAVGVVVAAGALGMWVKETGEDAEHRARAVTVTGTVTSGWDDDLLQRMEVEHPGLPSEVRVETLTEYPRGERLRVRVDPTDTTWAEPELEETDRSYWISLAVVAGGVAAALAAFRRKRRRAAQVVADEGVEVEIRVYPLGEALLRPVGGGTSFASFSTGPPRARTPDPGAVWSEAGRGLPWTRGVVVGDLRERGWVQVRTAEGVVTPAGTIVSGVVDDAEVKTFLDAPEQVWAEEPKVGIDWGAAFRAVVGLGIAAIGLFLLPAELAAARGEGVPGTLTVVSVECGRSCSVTGDFRSDDGSLAFRGVYLDAEGEVGERLPAVYVGDGERPEEVYVPGWGGVVFDGVLVLVGLATVGSGVVGVVEARRRRAPGPGRQDRSRAGSR